MAEPLVSIVIPLFNREEFITETVKSLQNQTYPNWEALIVDDGSTDASVSVAQQLAQQDARVLVRQRDRLPKGGATCRNIGVENATGTYLIFLDSDDLLAPFCLQQRVSFMQQNPTLDFGVFMGQLFNKTIGDNDKLINIPTGEDNLARFLKHDTPWLVSNPIWKTASVKTIPWSETLSCFQDYDFHLSALFKDFAYTYVPAEPDCYWRRGDYETISKSTHRLDRVDSIKQVTDRIAASLRKRNQLAQYKALVQSSYIDVLNRALQAGHYQYSVELLEYLLKTDMMSQWQLTALKGYVAAYRLSPNNLYLRLLKKAMRKLLGTAVFDKHYGTFIRVRKVDFYASSKSVVTV